MIFKCTFENKHGAELEHATLCRDCYNSRCSFYEDREIYGNIEAEDFDTESCEECGEPNIDHQKAWSDLSNELK